MLKYEDLLNKDGLNLQAVQPLLKAEAGRSRHKIVVLDDDPTGVQTLHDVPVYTDWTCESIRNGFKEPGRVFFILTNSRSFTEEKTREVHWSIGYRLCKVSQELGMEFSLVSRGDSTLRGHYPAETEVLRDTIKACTGEDIHGEIICPFFLEGGRFTVHNIHYVKEGDRLTPAGETEFAKDRTFGYRSSDLRDYIEEKTGGRYKKENVHCVSIERLRSMDIDGVENLLMSVSGFDKVVVNAADSCDIKVFCIALYRAIARGKRFLYRTAAGFVKEFAAVEDRGLLAGRDMIDRGKNMGGLVIVGSHTHKTTAQLEYLRGLPGIRFIEFNSDTVLEEDRLEKEIAWVVRQEESCISQGITAVVYTRRRILTLEGDNPRKALERSVKISEAVQQLAGRLRITPSFIVAKGGITSSDVGTKALHVKRAWVQGQIQPGIPVWRTGPESRFPGIPYIIFPGNVGEDTTLRDTLQVLLEAVKNCLINTCNSCTESDSLV